MSELSIIYVLTNPAMPGLVKIGITGQSEAEIRIAQLYSTGVPVPFEIAAAVKVENGEAVEKALHTAFSSHRINPKREFFKIDPEQAIVILRLLQKEDAKAEISQQTPQVDAESIAAGVQLRKRRPNMNYQEMGIPVGATLHFTEGEHTAIILGPKMIKLGEEEMTLTAATRKLSNTEYDRPPAMYWTYNGKLLREIYEETYEATEE